MFLFCWDLFLQILEKSQELKPAKIFCDAVLSFFHGI